MNSSIFKSVLNPLNGTTEWVLEDEDYDYIQEIARSGYADMLHDEERNIAFRDALASAIASVKQTGRPVHVLDIGTGTGLLSMLAARLGADKVTACEAFLPMAITAENIMLHNKVKQFIQLVMKRSTDMDQGDMFDGERADVCVAEVFDTELIGEGALRTFKEAHERLLKKGARVIPSSGKVFAMPIHSTTLRKFEKCEVINIPQFGMQIHPPPACLDCPGTAAVHDVQLDQIPEDMFQTLVEEPVEVFSFNFESLENMSQFNATSSQPLSIKQDLSNTDGPYCSQIDAVLMWWVLDMDGTGQIMLSTEPRWIRRGKSQWRDHWMQAIYYLPTPLKLEPNQRDFTLHSSHDEYSFWFAATSSTAADGEKQPLVLDSRPVCSCSLHSIFSRAYIGRFNDSHRYAKWASALAKVVPSKTCLCISDCSLIPLIAVGLGASHVFCIEANHLAAELVRKYVAENNMASVVTVINKPYEDLCAADFKNTKPEILFGDPFYFSSMISWDNFTVFHNCMRQLVTKGLVDRDVLVLPKKMRLKFMAVEMDDLWKIRAPVGYVEDCNMKKFDGILMKAIKLADGTVESHSLWEYPCKSLSAPGTLREFSIDPLQDCDGDLNFEKSVELTGSGSLNGVALWTEWALQDDSDDSAGDAIGVLSDGLRCESSDGKLEPGEYAKWDLNSKQGMYFMSQPFYQLSADKKRFLVANVNCDEHESNFTFKFKVKTEK